LALYVDPCPDEAGTWVALTGWPGRGRSQALRAAGFGCRHLGPQSPVELKDLVAAAGGCGPHLSQTM
jgi:hypothetical protein